MGYEETDYDNDVPEGRVISQSVNAGDGIWRGSSVDIVSSLGPETISVDFSLSVSGTDYYYISNGNCYSGLTGYDDVYSGATIYLSGSNGSMSSATLSVESGYGTYCTYTATFDSVPQNQGNYELTVGNRTPVLYTLSEMNDRNWEFDLTLGD